MNERIFQLVGQAISKVPVPITFNHEHSIFAEKFSELIVRECMELTQQCSTGKGIHDLFADEIIAEHFGVEE